MPLLEAGDNPRVAKVSNPAASVEKWVGGQVWLSAGTAPRWVAGNLSPVLCNVEIMVASTHDAFFALS